MDPFKSCFLAFLDRGRKVFSLELILCYYWGKNLCECISYLPLVMRIFYSAWEQKLTSFRVGFGHCFFQLFLGLGKIQVMAKIFPKVLKLFLGFTFPATESFLIHLYLPVLSWTLRGAFLLEISGTFSLDSSLLSVILFCMLSCFSNVQPSVHGDYLGMNTGVGCSVLLQRIFLIQGSNLNLLCLLHWLVGSLPLVPPGKPNTFPFIKKNLKQLREYPRKMFTLFQKLLIPWLLKAPVYFFSTYGRPLGFI